MKIELNLYEKDKPNLMLSWSIGSSFEQSVIDAVFKKDKPVLAQRFGNCISLTAMDEELEKIIERYFKKKDALSRDGEKNE